MIGTLKAFIAGLLPASAPAKSAVRAAVCAAVLLLAASCRVHEWPDPSTPASLELELVFSEEMQDYDEIISYENGQRMKTADYSRDDMAIRHILRFYPGLPGGGYSSNAASDYTVVLTRPATEELNLRRTVSLPEGRWKILCWTDYVVSGGAEDLFYETGDFSAVTLPENHVAGTDFKDAFRGVDEVELRRMGGSESPVRVTLGMERPLAKYRFIATDFDALVTKVKREKSAGAAASGDASTAADPSLSAAFNPEDYYIRFTYGSFMPCVFDMFKDKPTDSRTGVGFDSVFIPLSDKEVLMGFDYVLVSGYESGVYVQAALCDGVTGEVLSRTPSVLVPLVRNRVTTVRGDFLTMGAGSGISVNPDFEDDINIYIR